MFPANLLDSGDTLKRALIIENSKTQQAIICSLLANKHIQYYVISALEDAQKEIEEPAVAYDLIVTSAGTFDKDLKPFLSRLRAKKQFEHTPVVLITSDKKSKDEAFYAMGVTQVFNRSELQKFNEFIDIFLTPGAFDNGAKIRIVIVEDDSSQQLVIRTVLENHRCECFCFTSAEAALEEGKDLEPHAILTDFYLSGDFTGLDLVHTIKAPQHAWSKVPILVMSALEDSARKFEFLRSGANEFLIKPLDLNELTVRVENLVRYKQLLDTVELQRQEMQRLAMHDHLTGLYNRHFVANQVGPKIKEAFRHGIPFSVILLDVDDFKAINDNHGHNKGDEVLRGLADLLQNNSRDEDIVARLGGEEIILFLNHCDLAGAVEKADYIRRSIEETPIAELSITASFGVAQLSEEFDTFDALFKASDVAVYEAKTQGKNRVVRAETRK